MSGRKPYKMTLADLRSYCTLLYSIEVVGKDSKHEKLVGRNRAGEIVVQSKPGKITPARVVEFRDAYSYAVTAGVIKPHATGSVDGPDDPPGHANR